MCGLDSIGDGATVDEERVPQAVTANELYTSLDFTSPDDYVRLAASIEATAARLRGLLGRAVGDADRHVLADALCHLDRYAREIDYDWERL